MVKATPRQGGQFGKCPQIFAVDMLAVIVLSTAAMPSHLPGVIMFSEFSRFKDSKKLIHDGRDLFYVFPDKLTQGLPTTLEDAFDQGFLVIVCTDKPGQYSLNIANENYTGDFNGLALILFDWAHGEGYQWPEVRRVTLPGEPEPIRYRQTVQGHRIAWDEPGENF